MMDKVFVKICGVTDPANARMAVEMGADMVGLNFCSNSPRCIDVDRAREIVSAVREVKSVLAVGVFVNMPIDEVLEIEAQVGLELVQFSGDEPPEYVARFADRGVKVFRTGGDPGAEELARWKRSWAWLFDAPHDALRGGTGSAWDYGSIADVTRRDRDRIVFVAGGIGPDNVRHAIEASRPRVVDVCSRVESAPGIKDPKLLRRLFQEVRNAQSETPP
jgi:phosphoribosylanthranilate isomerase